MSLPTRRLVAAGLCLAAGLAGTALLAPPAQAGPGLTGKQLVSAASANTSTPQKTQKAYCPAGKVVISGGAFISGPLHIKITMTRPQPTGNYWEAAATNPWGRASWSLSTYAVCAARPAGLVYVTEDSVPDASSFRAAVAACPNGKQVLGVGARAAAEPGRNVTLNYVFAAGGGTTAFAGSNAAQGGEPDNWTTRAYAVCASPLGATYTSDNSPTGSASGRTAVTSCAPGRLAAAGGTIQSVAPAGNGEISFTSIYPDGTLTQGVARANEDHDGYGGNWTLGAWAICA